MFKFVNWGEYISLAVLLFFVKFSFLDNFGFKTNLSYPYFFSLLLSFFSIVIIGDFFIQNNSLKKTKKEKIINIFYFSTLLLFSFLTNLYISYKINKYEVVCVYLLLIVISAFYIVSKYKKTFLSNIILASFKPLSVIFLWYLDFPVDINIAQWKTILKLEIVLIYIIILSFSANFIKHVIIDIINKKRDSKLKHKTLPVVFGEKRTKKILIGTIIISHIIAVLMVSLLLSNTSFPYDIIIFLYIFMIIIQITFSYLIIKAKQKEDYNKIIKKITNTLLFGLIIFPIVTYLLKNAS